VEAEYWAHHYADNGAKEEFEDDDFDAVDDDVASMDEWEDLIDDTQN
jgi:hypothetical protein